MARNKERPVARRARESATSAQGGSRQALLIGAGALVLLVVLAAAWLGRDKGTAALDLSDIPQQGTTLGNPDAPLLIREFTDYSCPTCKRAAESLVPQIIERYVRSGQARLEVIPVSLVHPPDSTYAAMAALCAAEQNQIWAYQEQLFEAQGVRRFDPTTLANLGSGLDLDAATFQNCVASGKYQRQVEANNELFQSSGAQGTPTFLIGDQAFSGIPEWAQVQGLIDSQLTPTP